MNTYNTAVGVLTFWVYENLFVQVGLLDVSLCVYKRDQKRLSVTKGCYVLLCIIPLFEYHFWDPIRFLITYLAP